MNNQEICRFVNSKDIKQHLLTIDYNFTTVEAAWLVYQCKAVTLSEKMDAWMDIIKTMPDSPIYLPKFGEHYESILKVVSDFVGLKRRAIELFLIETPSSFYQFTIVYGDGSIDYEDSMLYSSYENCFQKMKLEL